MVDATSSASRRAAFCLLALSGDSGDTPSAPTHASFFARTAWAGLADASPSPVSPVSAKVSVDGWCSCCAAGGVCTGVASASISSSLSDISSSPSPKIRFSSTSRTDLATP
ncbi:unnamed protein product [Ectocarpus sp. 4 AP-2014]